MYAPGVYPKFICSLERIIEIPKHFAITLGPLPHYPHLHIVSCFVRWYPFLGWLAINFWSLA